MNQTPDPTGLIPERDAKRSAEFGAELKKRLETPLARMQGEGTELEVKLPQSAKIDHVVMMEDITQGERVLEYGIEAMDASTQTWRPISNGSAIGHKKIDVVNPPIQTQQLRFRCFKSVLKPVIRTFEVYGHR
jgi:alpha-L-fucosidase